MNYYERHIGDYLKDTAHLSLLEHGVYGRLLDVYYTREAPIPAAQVERLSGVRTKEERDALRNVLDEFFTVDGDLLRHGRCDREIDRYQEKQRKAAASANARWKKGQPQTERNANAGANAMRTHMRTHCDGNAPNHQTPDTSNQESSEPSGHQQRGGPPVGPAGPARAGFADPAGADPAVSGLSPDHAAADPAQQAAQAMQAVGLADVSASHPRLVALVAAGITASELAEAARSAVKAGRGFPWALARAEGQRRDAASAADLPPAPPPGPPIDPDSRAAIEADGERLGLGRWQQLDRHGRTVPWSTYADRVRQARASQADNRSTEAA